MAAGETALITGATEGIGFELSRLFARDGYDLALVARNVEKLNRISEDFSREYGISARVIPKDLSDPAAPEEIYRELEQASVEVDALVNNAGYTIYGPFAETDMAEERDMLQVLMWAPTKLTKLFLQDMLERNKGKILNLGSTGSFTACPFESIYGAAKSYILFFSESIAEELAGSNVTVTVLCPGTTKTQFFSRSKTDGLRISRLGAMSAEEVARTGYEALMKNKRYVVPGVFNKVMVFGIRLTPRFLVPKITKFILT